VSLVVALLGQKMGQKMVRAAIMKEGLERWKSKTRKGKEKETFKLAVLMWIVTDPHILCVSTSQMKKLRNM